MERDSAHHDDAESTGDIRSTYEPLGGSRRHYEPSESPDTDTNPPKDRKHIVYLALLTAGIGFVLPYNSFIIAADYWKQRFPGENVPLHMSMTYIVVAFGTVLLNNVFLSLIPFKIRIHFGYAISFTTLVFVALCEVAWHMFAAKTAYSVTLAAVSLVAIGCTVQQSSFYGFASMLPKQYTQAVMAGESLAGFLVSSNRVVTKLLIENNRLSTMIFFLTSSVYIGISYVLHTVTAHSPFVRYHIKACAKIVLQPYEGRNTDSIDGGDSTKYGVLTLDPSSPTQPTKALSFSNPVYELSNPTAGENSLDAALSDGGSPDPPAITTEPSVAYKVEHVLTPGSCSRGRLGNLRGGFEARWRVAHAIYPYMVCIALAYCVTLSLYPGIEVQIDSCALGSWMPVLLMFTFNTADVLGKILAAVPYAWSRRQLTLMSGLRTLLVPLLLLCCTPRERPVVSGETPAFFFTAALGISNGLAGSLPMILAPAKVPATLKEVSGNMMTLSYQVGLTAGSLLGLTLGLFIIVLYICGAIVGAVLLSNREIIAKYLEKTKDFLGFRDYVDKESPECSLCDRKACEDHRVDQWRPREPWRGWSLDEQLDKAVDRFYTRILTSFVESWFSLVSRNENFVQLLKENLREATCRLVLKMRQIDAPLLLTDKLLPCVFVHHETVANMLAEGVSIEKLSATFVHQEFTVHPAALNRGAELEYLRGVARCLMPRLLNIDQLESRVLGTLLRELLTCWVLLPLMDAISDPNLINLLIVVATNPRSTSMNFKESYRVTFLEAFVNRNDSIPPPEWTSSDDLLADQTKLYSFMQFLKREGAVDMLRFHLDVDHLNRELLDPRLTTDPAKVSALQQQSEKLLDTYQTQMQKQFGAISVKTLTEAHEVVRKSLQGHWRKAFRNTPEYFRLVYGDRDVHADEKGGHNQDHAGSTISRLSKLKGVIRGAVDGAPLDSTEIPTVWDAFSESQAQAPNPTIYSSVTQKLRKERGQNLDNFMVSFMQSIEQTTDVGEDVIEMREESERRKPNPPGRNLVFGDLFEVHKNAHLLHNSSLALPYTIKGPSQCLVYILTRILVVPSVIVKFALALIRLSRTTVDSVICRGLAKLVEVGLHEPRLAFLLTLLEEQIFGAKHAEPAGSDLKQRRELARRRIVMVSRQLGNVLDTLQSPALNKHLIYCLFDIIVAEMFPEMDNCTRE